MCSGVPCGTTNADSIHSVGELERIPTRNDRERNKLDKGNYYGKSGYKHKRNPE